MDDVKHGFGDTLPGVLPDPHRNCPPLDHVLRGRVQGVGRLFVLRCQGHLSKGDRVIGAIYGNHLVDRLGCRQFPPPHIADEADEFTIICDKCGREWTVELDRLKDARRNRKLTKIDVQNVSRGHRFLGGP